MSPVCIGAHVSRSHGYGHAAKDIMQMGGRCFQIFTGAPQRLLFPMDVLAKKSESERQQILEDFQHLRERASLPANHANHLSSFIHSPYTINLCDSEKQALNAKVLVQELEMADLMGAQGVVVHTGTRRFKQAGQLPWQAYEAYVATVKRVLQTFRGKARILLETSAGQGHSIGVTMQDFGRLYNAFTEDEQRERLGIVIDTCHVYVAGYDMSTPSGVDAYVQDLFSYVRRSDVKLIHLNDSAKELGSKVDRHAPLGKGYIYHKSFAGLEALLGYFPHTSYVLETHDKPPYAQYAHEIAKVQSLTPRQPKLLATGPKLDRHHTVVQRMRNAFEELATLYYAQHDTIRGDAYSEAVYRIEMLPTHELPTTKHACMQLPGIGNNLSDKLLELYYTDQLEKLIALKTDARIAATIELLKIPGVGTKAVTSYLEQGIDSMAALRLAVEQGTIQLNKVQSLGLRYMDDLDKRIPRTEAEALNHVLQPLVGSSSHARIELVGSYRRGKSTLGDIDVLSTGLPMSTILHQIERAYDVKGYVAKGQTKATLLVVLKTHVRHVDIFVTNESSYPYALLHFTGSKFFNMKLRAIAKQQGYTLSEHGLRLSQHTQSTGPHIEAKKEDDIFKQLGLTWISPEHR